MISSHVTSIYSKFKERTLLWLGTLFLFMLFVTSFKWLSPSNWAFTQTTQSSHYVYLPVVLHTQRVSRVYSPYLEGDIKAQEAAVFWFGKVTMAENYADVRVVYNANELYISVHVFDRLLWYDPTPITEELTDWDAISLYFDTSGGHGNAPHSDAYQLVAQLNRGQDPRDPWQAAYRGINGDWLPSNLDFTTNSGWRGNSPNDDVDDRGWNIRFHLPFSSLGLAGPPTSGSQWGLGLILHDRDAAGTPPLPIKRWPDTLDTQRPSTWGKLMFGLLDYTPPAIQPSGSTIIRQGLNGVQVMDAHVGGHSVCGKDYAPVYFDGWGDANYAGYTQINIQNQWDVADWPCFSKFYVTFPLDTLPSGKNILSATARLHMFSNAGIGTPNPPGPSLIQVLVVGKDWSESSLTWNNAPLPLENISRTWVYPIGDEPPPPPGTPYDWDVTPAVAQAYAAGEPLRIVFYSADTAQNSGKYFHSSDAGPSLEEGRPTLEVFWGEP